MEFDYSELRGRIRTKYGTEWAFAEALGMSRETLSSRFNNKTEWTSVEIVEACRLLDIDLIDAPTYFFTQKVVFSQQIDEVAV